MLQPKHGNGSQWFDETDADRLLGDLCDIVNRINSSKYVKPLQSEQIGTIRTLIAIAGSVTAICKLAKVDMT